MPTLSGLILVMTVELGGSWPIIIWLWSWAFTSIQPTLGVADGHVLGRLLPDGSITSSGAGRLDMSLTCRSPTPMEALIRALFRGVYSFSWALPEQGGRLGMEGWDTKAEVPTGDGTEPCWPEARPGEPGKGCWLELDLMRLLTLRVPAVPVWAWLWTWDCV